MSIIIPNPQSKKLVQPNVSDVLGSIYISQNLDVQENIGRLRVGKRLIINSADTDSGLAELYNPVAFASYNGVLYTLGGTGSSGSGYIYKNSSTSLHSNFVKDTTGTEPTDIDSNYSDMIAASNGNLYATSDDTLYECVAGTWGATQALTTAGIHALTSYSSRLYVSNLANKIYSGSISTGTLGTLATTGSYTLTVGGLDSEANTITFLRSSASRIWMGTVNTKGGKGYVHSWDGQSTTVSASYRLESSGALSCTIKDEVPHIIDSNGDLLAFNGGTFQKLTGFNKKGKKTRLKNAISSRNNRFIHPNGMAIIDGKINILINNQNDDNSTTITDTIPSGVWEYTPENGLVHKYGLGLTKSSDTIIDYGQNRVARVGALAEFKTSTSDIGVNTNGTFLVGSAVYTDATTVKALISYEDENDTLQKAGTWVTPFVESTQVEDVIQKIIVKHKKLLNSSDKIVIKSRTLDVESVEATITWTSTTTFTVPNSSVVVSNYWTAGTGQEVEVIQGLGSGKCTHITNAVNNAGTWTVTVDETFTSATGTSKARFTNWDKVGVIQNQVMQWQEESVNKTDIAVQFKVWFLSTGKNEIHSLNIISKTHKPLI